MVAADPDSAVRRVSTRCWGAQRVMRQRVNRMHYSFFDTFGDSALNARPFSLTGGTTPKVSSWTESAGIQHPGGPLRIPHVYDGSDKTFFFLNVGGTWRREILWIPFPATVPTAAERMGDFSGENIQLFINVFNPATKTVTSSLMTNVGCANPANAPGTCIPTSMPVSSQASRRHCSLSFHCRTCRARRYPCPTLNFHLQTNIPSLNNRVNLHITHQISSKLSLAANYNFSGGTAHSLSSFPGIEGDTFNRGQGVTIGLTQNFTKTFLHTSQFYFTRTRTLGLNEFSNLTNISAQLGILGVSTAPFDFWPAIHRPHEFHGTEQPQSFAEPVSSDVPLR